MREGRDGCYPVGKNLTRHPELGATHVATCDNVGSICNDYIKSFLGSINVDLNPSPAFQAPSAQGRQGHTHRTALRFPLSPQVARGKIRSIGNMKENIFTDMVFSRFTSHFSLKTKCMATYHAIKYYLRLFSLQECFPSQLKSSQCK